MKGVGEGIESMDGNIPEQKGSVNKNEVSLCLNRNAGDC